MIRFLAAFIIIIPFLVSCSTKQSQGHTEVAEVADIPTAGNQNVAQYLLGPAQFKQELESLENGVLLDIRTVNEYRNGTISGSINMDYFNDRFRSEIDQMDRNRSYFVFCHVGGRSASARSLMNQMGFENVFDLEGGIVAWQKYGYPLVRQE